jgi:hypothetical protein
MLKLTKGATNDTIVLTLHEKLTLEDNYSYVFTFTHSVTKQVVTFEKQAGQDISTYPERYNEFTINTSVVFNSYPVGLWHYEVKEKDTQANEVLGILEVGIMMLVPSTEFEYEKYETATTYKQYNG